MKETKFKQTLVQTKKDSRHCEERSDVAIQSGFKMTEVGMIPNNWEIKPLKDIAGLKAGKMTSYNDFNPKYPCFGGNGIRAYLSHYSHDGIYPIIGRQGELCGNVNLAKGKFYATEHAVVASPKKDIDAIWLYYQLTALNLNQYATGCAQPGLSVEKINDVYTQVPPTIKEQQRIANALSDVDTLIGNLEKLIAKKKNIKQGAMQQLLTGKKRLPGFGSDERTGSRPTDERRKECHSERSAKREVEESSGYKMTELGLIPSDWLQMKLRDLCYLITKQTGFDYSATIKPSLVTEESKETLPFIQNKDFEGTSINFATDFFIPKNIAANFPKILLNEPVLLISISGKIGNVAYFSHERDAFIGGAVGVARFNEKKYIKWTNLFLQSEYGQKQIFANEKSGAQHNLTIEDVRNLNVYMPSSCEEQTAIANVLSDMDAEISALETKLAKYRTLKIGMMQQLLTGKIRLL